MADARQALKELQSGLGEKSRFVSMGSVPSVLPGLDVTGVGLIGTPVSESDARRMIAQASQAPYGRGEETIVDTSVRRVWQIEPKQFKLTNPQWTKLIESVVGTIQSDFGISQPINAQLYKLLVYEPGSFFAAHRDSEKIPDMFATLVVCLPSPHQGGTLVIQHDGQTQAIEFGGNEHQFETQFAAFYADCQHEIRPVTSGYRVCLVYNLALSGRKQPKAPVNSSVVEQAARLLKELLISPGSEIHKLAIPFAHQYTAAGLDPRQLKGSDRVLLDVLDRAARSIDCQCHVGLLTDYETGSAEYTGYTPRRSRRWSRYDDEEELDDDGDTEHVTMYEVFDQSMTVGHWFDPQGQPASFGEMHFTEQEILCKGDREGWSVQRQVHEATGNEGATLDRWYRQGVVVIWPRKRYFRILASEGQLVALPVLEEMLAAGPTSTERAEAQKLAHEIISYWQARSSVADAPRSCFHRMAEVLAKLGDKDLVEQFINSVLPADFDNSAGLVLVRLFEQHGWQSFARGLNRWLSQQVPKDYDSKLAPIVLLAESLCCDPPAMTPDRLATCESLVESLLDVVQRWDADGQRDNWHRRDEGRTGIVASIVHILTTLSQQEQLDQFLTRILQDSKRYQVHEVLIPDVRAIHAWLPKVPEAQSAAERLRQHCVAVLNAATATPVEPPSDWAREGDLNCKCEYCQTLSRFLKNPDQKVERFRVRKDLRQHLHRQIDNHKFDLTHVTDRSGSPQTLVCTKTQASYERRLKRYQLDQQLLAELQSLPETPVDPKPKKRTVKKPKS